MKMSFEILLLIAVILILIYLSFHFAQNLMAPGVQKLETGTVWNEKKSFTVEIAKTETERDRGLMFRKELANDRGMLFVFDKEGVYPFWMKNTFIPLDMIWMDSSGKIVFIGKNIQPCKTLICPSVIPEGKAKYVLEINAGLSEKIGWKAGDKLNIKY